MKKKRVVVYVDGFNLYHALKDLKDERIKWVNIWSLSESLTRGGEDLCGVKYFSAYATWKPEQYAHHRAYVSFLECFDVETVLGKFKGGKNVVCNKCGERWAHHEEKETDVNIALNILRDGFEDNFDRAIIITADSDLVPVIKQCKELFPKKEIFVATPPGRHNNAHEIRSFAPNMNISKSKVKQHLLPKKITLYDGSEVCMPEKYQIR